MRIKGKIDAVEPEVDAVGVYRIVGRLDLFCTRRRCTYIWTSSSRWCGVCTGTRSQSGTAGSIALTWQAMCCGHEGSYRCDRTVTYVSRSRVTSWGSFETKYSQTLEDTQDIEHYFVKEHKTSSLSSSISNGTTPNPEDVEEEKMKQKEDRVD